MNPYALTIVLPDWTQSLLATCPHTCATLDARMQLAISLAHENIQQKTGGPFGAAVFERDSGRLVALGMNLVLNQQCSAAHAEILALTGAQRHLGQASLAPERTGQHFQLVTSVAPCAMCLGALPWSGITSLVCGARGEDAEAIGFDEGSKPQNWQESLRKRNIEVIEDVQREEARSVLTDYSAAGGPLY
ncbi:nucleoside deaminase [Planctomycetota bacterium]